MRMGGGTAYRPFITDKLATVAAKERIQSHPDPLVFMASTGERLPAAWDPYEASEPLGGWRLVRFRVGAPLVGPPPACWSNLSFRGRLPCRAVACARKVPPRPAQ